MTRAGRILRASALAALLGGPAAAQVCLCIECMTTPLDRFTPVATSMAPAFLPGDCVIFDTADRDPTVGEVILQDTGVGTFIRRVVALEGATVGMTGGRLVIDGEPVPTEPRPDYELPAAADRRDYRCTGDDPCRIARSAETLGGVTYETLDLTEDGPLDDVPPILVPPGHVFLLGDNRDNAVDSRMPSGTPGGGPVPLSDIIGTYVRHQTTPTP